jgi:hypothetical protein
VGVEQVKVFGGFCGDPTKGFSRPWRDWFGFGEIYPGLRPGLLSIVPSGLLGMSTRLTKGYMGDPELHGKSPGTGRLKVAQDVVLGRSNQPVQSRRDG